MTDQSSQRPPAGAPKRPATSTQVARAAGVSRTTVSFVLNNVLDKGISEATRAKVLRVAQELGYQPNAAAQSLASGSTGTVALVVPRAEHLCCDQFLAQLLAGVSVQCHALGLKLMVESAEHDSPETSGFVTLVRTRRIDGLVVANPRDDQLEHLRSLVEADVPMVVMGPPREGKLDSFHTCGQDSGSFTGLAVRHLLDLGHRDIACIGLAGGAYFAAAEREAGWRQALVAAGVEPLDALLEVADVTVRSGYQAARRLLARGVRFTALFAGSDTIAFGALAALREAGLRVPQDVSVVGCDDLPLAEFAAPALTTVRTDPLAQGRAAMTELARMLGLSKAEAPLLPDPVLVVRASTGAPPGR